MTLRDVIERVEQGRQTLTLLNHTGTDGGRDDLATHFGVQNVAVETERTGSGHPEDVVLLHDGDDVLAASNLEEVLAAVSPDPAAIDAESFGKVPRPDVLRRVDTRTFPSYSKHRMVLASREVVHLAWRTGGGELCAGFQRLSGLESQWPVYEKIADANVAVTVYGEDDRSPPGHENVELDGVGVDEVADVWFVAYRGDAGESAVILAAERDENEYRGFWSYRSDLVESVVSHVRTAWA